MNGIVDWSKVNRRVRRPRGKRREKAAGTLFQHFVSAEELVQHLIFAVLLEELYFPLLLPIFYFLIFSIDF